MLAYRTNPAVIVPKAFWASCDQCIILIEIFTKTAARDFIFVTSQCAFRIATFCFLAFSLTPSSSFTALFFTQNYFQKLFHPSSLSLSLPPLLISFFIKSHRSFFFLIKRLFIRTIKLRQSIKERVWSLLHCKEGVPTQRAQRCL